MSAAGRMAPIRRNYHPGAILLVTAMFEIYRDAATPLVFTPLDALRRRALSSDAPSPHRRTTMAAPSFPYRADAYRGLSHFSRRALYRAYFAFAPHGTNARAAIVIRQGVFEALSALEISRWTAQRTRLFA